jgi:hypothetical protein
MSVKVSFEDFEHHNSDHVEEAKNAKIKEDSCISFSYDGGRLNIYVDGEEVYSSMLAGNDFSVTLNDPKK